MAVLRNKVDLIRVLVEQGADVNVQNKVSCFVAFCFIKILAVQVIIVLFRSLATILECLATALKE